MRRCIMDVLIGLAIYFTIGLVLAKVFVVYMKTSYSDMDEMGQTITGCLVFIYPVVILLGIAGCFTLLVDKLFKKIL